MILVVEKLSELRQILAVAREIGVEPDLGIRVRLHAKGARQMGSLERRPREVRPVDRGAARRRRAAARGGLARTASSSSTSTSARRSPTFGAIRQAVTEAARDLRQAPQDGPRARSTSTRAAGSASTTTAAARSSTARRTTASRSTPTTSSWRSRRSATTSKSPTPTSSPRAAARSSRITRCSSSRCSARSRRAARSGGTVAVRAQGARRRRGSARDPRAI